ncbi:MAG: 2-C-methyl-D-erythritol 2,4-cyclodiphosphate synthase [Planctomycetota bacterium]|jgi:2-C-methyl-D-erythritol 2,4-cyclodiphosphate synthase|nr:2-C-methyl-D-erythritol 2,4-cyclodiphosphate synthase [Planctomycetota bacterium]MDP6370139.1 2-C-methyl-D-erythritol 2,4-cyclodiphosphate synthase [Planctomycetota bacterium]MDP6519551.1 2-C-methyl-D-erythritol 2,4-cyclodiphosphate synthase [Planctomycetota bacterium]MDP6837634.1 2-C-methyl-D-erythritol 2,4-cyclodiphosphate synthase [Planctomycetota bacterium]MDP6956502.1 2-C-methyl-D-erythritol 2,4-cyclodiphosphate synthase [Planctomycetota bacterium]
MNARIGLGFDIHRLVPGRPCLLAGVLLDHERGPAGHSDGDAVLHAVTDSLLGAAGLDDLGTLFPDTDERWRGADSAELLRAGLELVRGAGFDVVNIDVVVATEGPRIAPARAAMRARLAELLGIDVSATNIKGKTLEGLTDLAREGAVAVQAVCLLSGG